MSLKRHAWPYARRDFHGINLAVVVLDEEQLARFDPRRAYVFKKWRIICDLARVSRSHEHHDRVLEASRDGVARALGSMEEVNGRAGAQQSNMHAYMSSSTSPVVRSSPSSSASSRAKSLNSSESGAAPSCAFTSRGRASCARRNGAFTSAPARANTRTAPANARLHAMWSGVGPVPSGRCRTSAPRATR